MTKFYYIILAEIRQIKKYSYFGDFVMLILEKRNVKTWGILKGSFCLEFETKMSLGELFVYI